MSTSLTRAPSLGTRNRRVPTSLHVTATTETTDLRDYHHPGPSNVTLFITNLRLLNLDLREDWPDIRPHTFSTKNGQQNQRHRIRCVEWALYQLFNILDPEIACTKLRPFFPPLEPLQSLNLRSALLRCLDQAKKNGTLGQDLMIRKTMLDECKGEKLEELLANLSHVVLKKTLSDTNGQEHEAIALRLALENLSYKGETKLISSLIYAHKVSLCQHLREKDQWRVKFRNFSELLNSIEFRLEMKNEKLKNRIHAKTYQHHTSEKELRLLQDKTRASCSQNLKWMQNILCGEASTKREPHLTFRFNDIWDHALNGTLRKIENEMEPTLLEQLDKRLQEQDNRLARWRDLENKLASSTNFSTEEEFCKISKKRESIDLNFTQHQNLQLGYTEFNESPLCDSIILKEYNQLIDNLRFELDEVEKNAIQKDQFTKIKNRIEIKEEETSIGKNFPASVEIIEDQDPCYSVINSKSQLPVEDTTSKVANTDRISKIPKFSKEQRPKFNHSNHEISRSDETKVRKTSYTRPKEQSNETLQPQDSNLLTRNVDNFKEELDLARQILDDISSFSPSPKKSSIPPSLVERTRLSMARTPHSQILKTSDETNSNNSVSDAKSLAATKTSQLEVESDSYANLVQRTRNSMAGFEAAQKKAQLDRRNSIKEEKKNQRKLCHLKKVEEKTTISLENNTSAIEFIEGDHDYESIFKSRPKIKTSPIISSRGSWHNDEHD
ncbi:hypothetical protein OnM2_064060 [Erysiphe neolycopersici]|uniref:HAUS augmin-like complex subunit 6 N-terminal domain-containing protein n=1 Tax=Erysiphe neolycopersici TaxID=212602 RepID=A0A420HNG1_9PEZI|nr:hypothetical protein OnM2_064060 [Erysiphe neolycopersici]